MQHYRCHLLSTATTSTTSSAWAGWNYIARGICSSDIPSSLRVAINQACRHLSGVADDLQPVLLSAPGVPSLETWALRMVAAVMRAAAERKASEREARFWQEAEAIWHACGKRRPLPLRGGAAYPEHRQVAVWCNALAWQ